MNKWKVRFFDDRLSDRSVLYSSLKDECVCEKRFYLHVLNVWNMFEVKTMGDYHDLYLKA